MKKFFLIAFLIALFDQIIKLIVAQNLLVPIQLIESFLELNLVHNTGASFGLFQGTSIILSVISVLVIILIIYYLPKISKGTEQILFAIILGGITGNLIDRIIRGYVIDYISFRFWPAFNIADSAITIGAISLIILYSKKEFVKN